MARVETITGLERIAARHWRGTEEARLGDWLLRAADGFTGRANSALPLGDPGMPLDDALAAVTRWYRDRALPPMIAVPVPLEGDSPCHQLDNHLSERSWPTRPGPAFVMVADLPAGPTVGASPTVGRFRVDAEPDDLWLAGYRQQKRQPPVMRTVLMSAQAQAFVSVRADDGEVLGIGRLSISDGWAGITAVEVNQSRRRAGLGMALTGTICAEAAARTPRPRRRAEGGAAAVSATPIATTTASRRDPRPRRHAGDGVFRPGWGSRYVCNHGYPCVQGPVSFAKRAAER